MKRLLSIIVVLFAGIAVTTAIEQDKVYRSVAQMPRFPGGEAALMKYIDSHLQEPQIEEKIVGNVILQFVVESDGNIGEAKVVRSLHPDYDKEALRVVKSLPKFTPGRQNGQAVAVWYTLPVIFKQRGDYDRGYGYIQSPSFGGHRDTTIYRSVEHMPQFPGGEAALMKYINSHLQKPSTQERIDGSVIVQFVVQSDGSIGEVKVVRSLHPDYDKEAVRVVKSLPKFSPGRQNGQVVAVWYTVPVNFR